ncbi:queuosine precursor transporter [Thermincola potens]|uniref:Probable queuosine precursor transporter n=1 Tax=Thermincola potens (strain JR) TaxID=635013 RepID=D5XDG4_THEPJ|nr:queuosine precursor transporter [Thermincola potens]ADG81812.1 conserved hypothetical protein [Thermincola potens JR]
MSDQINMDAGSPFNKFTVITSLYIILLIISNLMATKLVTFWGMVLPAAVIAYPLCFMTGDVLTEVWGYKTAKKVIWLGFFANFLLVVWTNIGVYMPYPDFWQGQEHYKFIFNAVPRITLASFAGYIFGELTNSWSLEFIKKFTGERFLFIRTIGSSVIGQVLDTLFFFTIGFYGTVPNKVLITMIVTQYLFKVACEALGGTPLAYMLVKWAKKDNSVTPPGSLSNCI